MSAKSRFLLLNRRISLKGKLVGRGTYMDDECTGLEHPRLRALVPMAEVGTANADGHRLALAGFHVHTLEALQLVYVLGANTPILRSYVPAG